MMSEIAPKTGQVQDKTVSNMTQYWMVDYQSISFSGSCLGYSRALKNTAVFVMISRVW